MAGQMETIKYGAIGLAAILAYFKIVKPLLEPANLQGITQGVGMGAVAVGQAGAGFTQSILDQIYQDRITPNDLSQARSEGISFGREQRADEVISAARAVLPALPQQETLAVARATTAEYQRVASNLFSFAAPILPRGFSNIVTNAYRTAGEVAEQQIVANTTATPSVSSSVQQAIQIASSGSSGGSSGGSVASTAPAPAVNAPSASPTYGEIKASGYATATEWRRATQ